MCNLARIYSCTLFTPSILSRNMDTPSKFLAPEQEYRVQIVKNDEFQFLGMKMSWCPEGDLQFGLFREKGQLLKYVGKQSTHTPGTLHAIPSGVLNRLAKLTQEKPSIHAEAVEKIYPSHANALHKAGLAPPVFPQMGDLWRKQDQKVEIEKERDVSEKKNRNVYLCVAYSHYFSMSIHRVIDRLKKSFTSHG